MRARDVARVRRYSRGEYAVYCRYPGHFGKHSWFVLESHGSRLSADYAAQSIAAIANGRASRLPERRAR